MPILSPFWVKDPHPPSAPLCESFLQYFPVLEIPRNIDLQRNIIRRVILRQDIAQELGCVERTVVRQIFPKEFSSADDASLSHRKKLQRQPLFLSVIAKNIYVPFGRC